VSEAITPRPPSIIPGVERIDAEIAYHQQEIDKLRRHRRVAANIAKQANGQPLFPKDEENEKEEPA
jgi:hypothetical protein